MKRQEEAVCKGVSLDNAALAGFIQYMTNYDFRKMRFIYRSYLTKILLTLL